jgi:hypothetical protein
MTQRGRRKEEDTERRCLRRVACALEASLENSAEVGYLRFELL